MRGHAVLSGHDGNKPPIVCVGIGRMRSIGGDFARHAITISMNGFVRNGSSLVISRGHLLVYICHSAYQLEPVVEHPDSHCDIVLFGPVTCQADCSAFIVVDPAQSIS